MAALLIRMHRYGLPCREMAIPDQHKQHWFTAKECCTVLSMDLRQFRKYVSDGVFPRGIKRGSKLVVWSFDDLDAMPYLEENQTRFRRTKGQKPPDQPEK